MTKKHTLKAFQKLITYYSENLETWENKKYKEAQVREDFIYEFFAALGWKMSGIPPGMAPKDRDVLVEYSFKSDTTRSLDYIFKISNRNQFIVEAKKPSENIDNPKHVFQAKTYGFLSKIPFVILTNFKEIRIFDISTKPHINQVTEDLIFKCSYIEYLDNIDFLWDNFSKESVYNKSLVKLFVARRENLEIDLKSTDFDYIIKKGEQLLDTTFLDDLNAIRLELAQSMVNETKRDLSDQEINEATQRLIDIIIFIRFLEDNEIEETEWLRKLLNEESNLFHSLLNLSSQLNTKYNGLLFHRYTFFDEILIDTEVLKRNILKLYYPESPYNFSKISIEILGQIFEQYLAKRIINNNTNLSLVVKPEIQKAGGIYYTPEYIVDKILDNTLNNFLLHKTPSNNFNIAKILDMSCGSGIFLIKSYKRIIDFFENNPAKLNSSSFFQNSLGVTRLTMASKKQLLEKNIFGIDIDSQAVEIAKMSLYFTMLDNYNEDKSPRPILPSLKNNIICGNSVVDLSFFEDYPNASEKTINIVNPLSWENEGLSRFDIVVGNPPYLRIQLLEELYPEQYQEFIKKNYEFAHCNFDLSIIFVEQGISKLSKIGKLGFIIPNTTTRTKYGENFRGAISKNNNLSKLIHFNDYQVFQNSTTYTCLIFLDNEEVDVNEMEYLNVDDIKKYSIDDNVTYMKFDKSELGVEPWYFTSSKIHDDFLNLIAKNTFALKDLHNLEKIFVGLQPSINNVFLLEMVSETERTIKCYSNAIKSNHDFEKTLIKKMVKGSKNILRYQIKTNYRLLFPYLNDISSNKSNLISEADLKTNYPNTWTYLKKCEQLLKTKDALKGKDFYKYIYKKNHLLFDNVKILLPSLCYGSRFSIDENGEYYFTGSGEGGGGGYGLLLTDIQSDYNYFNLLGILNSKLISALIEIKGEYKKGGYKGIDRTFIHNIPLPIIKSAKKKEVLKEISLKTARLNYIYSRKQTFAVIRLKELLEKCIDDLVLQIYDVKESKIINLINELND